MIQASTKKADASDLVPAGWFRTIVQFNSSEAYKWPESSQGKCPTPYMAVYFNSSFFEE